MARAVRNGQLYSESRIFAGAKSLKIAVTLLLVTQKQSVLSNRSTADEYNSLCSLSSH